jgi:hypothetical protein
VTGLGILISQKEHGYKRLFFDISLGITLSCYGLRLICVSFRYYNNIVDSYFFFAFFSMNVRNYTSDVPTILTIYRSLS